MNDSPALSFFRRLRAQALAAQQRRVVLLRGEAGWCEQMVEALPSALGVAEARWLGAAPSGWGEFSGGVGEALGRELDLVGVDLRLGVDADLFGAISGSLRAGGLLLLVAEPAAVSGGGSRFAARWMRLLQAATEVVSVVQGGEWPAVGEPTGCAAPRVADESGCLTPDQRAAVDAVCRVATGHRRRPAVLTADRGRGKSAAFGLAAARLLETRAAHVLVTGPSLAAAEAVFAAVRRRLPDAVAGRGLLRHGDGELRFVAPDALVRDSQDADLLLVDEAAALPVGLLTRLLERYARIAFATTVHGYEGSGQAFSVRFSTVLDHLTPGWRPIELSAPVRWAAGDPLEALAARLLLLDAEPAAAEDLLQVRADDSRVERLDRELLARDETALRELFGLLVLAHYRTRPRDLLHWLDDEAVVLWGLRHEGHLAAVAVAVYEGGLDEDLAAAVGRGERRTHGHLLAQSLAAHLGYVEAAGLRGMRVVRIAVHPAVQRRGLGARLLEGVVDAARAEGLDWLGASFGAEPGLLRFWRAAAFAAIRVGFTREATSGAHAALVLRGLSPTGEALCRRAASRFAQGLPNWLGDPLRELEAPLALELLAQGDVLGISEAVRQEAVRFARGGCPFEDAQPWLRELCLRRLARVWEDGALTDREAAGLVAKLVQAQGWAEVAGRLRVPGRAQVIEVLRAAVEKILAAG